MHMCLDCEFCSFVLKLFRGTERINLGFLRFWKYYLYAKCLRHKMHGISLGVNISVTTFFSAPLTIHLISSELQQLLLPPLLYS